MRKDAKRSPGAHMESLRPLDNLIQYGMAVVHCTLGTVTVGGISYTADDNSVVLPNNAAARSAGRKFAGLAQDYGTDPNPSVSAPIDVSTTPTLTIQKSWIAVGRFKIGVSGGVGDEVGYDPADGGYLSLFDSDRKVYIGKLVQTLVGTSVPQLAALELCPASLSHRGMYYLADTGTVLTGTTSETVFTDLSAPPVPVAAPVPARRISTANGPRRFHLSGMVRALNGLAGSPAFKLYFGDPTNIAGAALLGTLQTATLTQDQAMAFEMYVHLKQSADQTVVPASSYGRSGAGASLTATDRETYVAIPVNVDLTAAKSFFLTATPNNSADQLVLQSFGVEYPA